MRDQVQPAVFSPGELAQFRDWIQWSPADQIERHENRLRSAVRLRMIDAGWQRRLRAAIEDRRKQLEEAHNAKLAREIAGGQSTRTGK